MKILHLSSEYPPQKVYGLGRFVHDLAIEQAKQGNEVHIVTNSMGGKDYDVVDNGVHVHRVDFPPPPKPADSSTTVVQFNVQVIERAVPLIKNFQPDVVNTHDWLTFLAGRVVNRVFSVPHIFTVHDTMIGKNFGKLDNPKKLGANIEKYGCEDANLVICCSQYMKDELVSIYQANKNAIRVIPCAVTESNFEINSDDFLTQNFRSVLAHSNEKIVTYVGRLDTEKGLETLLNAIPLVLNKYENVKFVIAGKGVMEDSIQNWIRQNKLQTKVQLVGYVQGDVLSHLYKLSDLHVMPSSYEPFGIVALEAMINKTLVVVSDSGGLAEIVDDLENGLKFKKGDFDHLANVIIKALVGEEKTKKIAQHGYEKAKNFYNWSFVAKETGKAYQECLIPQKNIEHKILPKKKSEAVKICLVVQAYEKDFELISENIQAFERVIEDGHKVVVLCYEGDKKQLIHWQDKIQIIEADSSVSKGHQYLIYKCISGYEQCLKFDWNWLVKIDADTLICGNIPEFIEKYQDFDAIAHPSTFKPVLDALAIVGSPDIPSDILASIGNKYMRGFFYCIKRSYIENALPIACKLASRVRMEDATFTAIIAYLGAKIYFCEEINYYNSFEKTQINLNSPVIHVESKNTEERKFFAKRANALFQASLRDTCETTKLMLSLVIHTRNRKNYLLRMLQTVKNAWVENEEIELIIIDYGGNDNLTKDLHGLRWQNLRYIYVDCTQTFSTAHARNIAFKAAKGEWIVALDCDLLLPQSFIADVLKEFHRNKEVCIYGPVYKIMPQEQHLLENNELDPVEDFSLLQTKSLANRIEPPAGSIIIAPRKKIFDIGGYDENYTGYGFQDIDLIERLKQSGVAQLFSEKIYALHQFHGYPKNYNTLDIEAKNRNYFLSNKDLKRNFRWGEMPDSQKNMFYVNWLETDSKKRKNYPADDSANLNFQQKNIIVWCEGLSPEEIQKVIFLLKIMPYKYDLNIRLVCSNAKFIVPYGFRLEHHSLAQIITQVVRADATIVPVTSKDADSLISSCATLKANHIVLDFSKDMTGIESELQKTINIEEKNLKILVAMDEGIGNMIMLTPMLRATKELFPKSSIFVLGCYPALDVLSKWDVVAGTISNNHELEKFYDMLFVTGWNKSVSSALSGVSFRYPPFQEKKINLQEHESKQHMDLVYQLGYSKNTPQPHCSHEEFLLEKSKTTIIGLADTANMSPQWQKKRWPHYRELAKILLDKGYSVFAFGGSNDKELYGKEPWPQGVVNYQDKLSILETAGALKKLDVLIANDSGLAHMAAALGVPTICLWGPSSLSKNKPLGNTHILNLELPCSPCQGTQNWDTCNDYQCLSRITLSTVQSKISELLRKQS